MKVSDSLLNTFQDCPRKYQLSYKKGLYSHKYSSGLAFGKFFHTFIEARLNLEEVDRTEVQRYFQDYPDNHDDINRDWSAACAAAESHIAFWDDPEREFTNKQFKTIAIEARMTMDMSDTEAKMTSYMDGILKAADEYILLERKTTGVTNRDQVKQQWRSSPQTRRYLRIMASKGMRSFTVLWDIVWKPAIRIRQAENMAEFTERLCNEYTEKPEKYFERFIQHIDPMEVAQTEIEDELLVMTLKECNEKIKGLPFPRNLNSCVGKYGACDFYGLCHEGQAEGSFKKKEWVK